MRHFANFLKEGAAATYLNPQFSTESFPNHWSMVTGCTVENHGIIADNFYDPDLKEHFSSTKTSNQMDSKWWNFTEPIWTSAARYFIAKFLL